MAAIRRPKSGLPVPQWTMGKGGQQTGHRPVLRPGSDSGVFARKGRSLATLFLRFRWTAIGLVPFESRLHRLRPGNAGGCWNPPGTVWSSAGGFPVEDPVLGFVHPDQAIHQIGKTPQSAAGPRCGQLRQADRGTIDIGRSGLDHGFQSPGGIQNERPFRSMVQSSAGALTRLVTAPGSLEKSGAKTEMGVAVRRRQRATGKRARRGMGRQQKKREGCDRLETEGTESGLAANHRRQLRGRSQRGGFGRVSGQSAAACRIFRGGSSW